MFLVNDINLIEKATYVIENVVWKPNIINSEYRKSVLATTTKEQSLCNTENIKLKCHKILQLVIEYLKEKL